MIARVVGMSGSGRFFKLCLNGTALVMGACLLLAAPRAANAQVPPPPSPTPADVINNVGIDQNLDALLPLDLPFVDENGQAVTLGKYFGNKKPVVLSLVYFDCPGLCTATLNDMTVAFRPLQFTAGKEFDVLTISFSPTDKPELAKAKRAKYLKDYNRPEAAEGWHFLTGDEASIRKLTQTVGFRYTYDARTGQYAHASAIMVATPQGKLSKYFYGLGYSSKDLKLGLIEASENKIGTFADSMTLLCYQYDPASGRYGLLVLRMLKAGAVLTVLTIGSAIFLMTRSERNKARALAAHPGVGDAPERPKSTDGDQQQPQ